MMVAPQRIELIGTELALLWPDGAEHYIQSEFLRAASPSAENTGNVICLGGKLEAQTKKHSQASSSVDGDRLVDMRCNSNSAMATTQGSILSTIFESLEKSLAHSTKLHCDQLAALVITIGRLIWR